MFAPCLGNYDLFTTTHDNRYAMPASPICQKLTIDRSVTATVVNVFVSVSNNLLSSDECAWLKSLGVFVLSFATTVLSVPTNLVETATKTVLFFMTRLLSLTCICDYLDSKPLFSNPLAQINLNAGKGALISLSMLFVGPYASLNMLFARKSLDMEEIVNYGSFGLTPKLTNCLYKH